MRRACVQYSQYTLNVRFSTPIRKFDIALLIVAHANAKVEAYAPRRRSVACGIPRIRDGLMADAMRESNPRPREPRPRVRTDRAGKPTLGLAQRPH